MRAKNVPLGIVALVFFLAFLWFVPEFQGKYFSQGAAPEDMPMLVNEYRRTWAQILFGFFVLLGLYFTWRRVEISQKMLETQQDQQVTERFTRAIDQLGATDDDGEPRLEIRLGGIYALERIAWDSPGRDYSTVIEVLTAYVRANAPYSPKASPDTGAVPNKQSEQEENGEQDKDAKQEAQHAPNEPSADIQAILDVLGRREEDRVPKEYRVRPNLRRTNLEGAILYRADLVEADLYRANLREADLVGADLRGASLKEASLTGANLFQANLTGANLRGANLTGADLVEADLRGASLTEANLTGADLRGATGITQEQLEQAIGDEAIKLPEGFTRPASWTTGTDEQADGDE